MIKNKKAIAKNFDYAILLSERTGLFLNKKRDTLI